MRAGRLTVFTGTMFSGKSTRLQAEGKKLEKNGKRILYVKPKIDDRYGLDFIATHNGSKVDATPKASISVIDVIEWVDAYDAILIDEIQFFDEYVVIPIESLLEEGIDVYVAGLNMDRFSKVFPATSLLMGRADRIEILKTECIKCGNDGWVTSSNLEDKKQVHLGTSENYYPLCRACFNKENNTVKGV